MILGLVAGLSAAALFGVGAVVQAHAVRRQDKRSEGLVPFVLRSARDPWTVAVVVAYLAGFVLHVVAIWELPLYLAQATVAMSLPVTAVTSMLLHERLQPVHWSAVVLVSAGLVLLSVGSGEPGPAFTSAWFAVVLWLGVGTLLLASRVGLRWSGSTLAGLAGFGYAGSAIAVRGAESPLDATSVAAALSVAAYGADRVLALLRGARPRPGVGGVGAADRRPDVRARPHRRALLGDGVRDGWWPAIVVGLLLATIGAVVLSGDSITSPVTEAPTPRADQAS